MADIQPTPNPNRLRTERELRGWSQGELADKSGLYQPDISNYETGAVFPGPKNAARLAEAFGVPTPVIYRWVLEPWQEVA